jgi:hypothetical protein
MAELNTEELEEETLTDEEAEAIINGTADADERFKTNKPSMSYQDAEVIVYGDTEEKQVQGERHAKKKEHEDEMVRIKKDTMTIKEEGNTLVITRERVIPKDYTTSISVRYQTLGLLRSLKNKLDIEYLNMDAVLNIIISNMLEQIKKNEVHESLKIKLAEKLEEVING